MALKTDGKGQLSISPLLSDLRAMLSASRT
jgi:hypothetical protein